MVTAGEGRDRHGAVSAAVRRFPLFELTIHRLMNADETFRELCEELAEAERALSRTDSVAPSIRKAWNEEWSGVVERLAAEVGTVLSGARPAGDSQRKRQT